VSKHNRECQHRTIDIAERLDRVEIDSLAFDGWVLSRVIEKVSRAGNGYLSYRFTRATEPARRSA
jgi:hypothetical protein